MKDYDENSEIKHGGLIILIVIAFFFVVGALALLTMSGNQAAIAILSIMGGLFLFFILIIGPASLTHVFFFQKIKFQWHLIFFICFWIIVYAIITIRPEWGWNYVAFFEKYIHPFLL